MSTVLPPIRWRPTANFSSRHGAQVNLVVVHRPVGSYESAIETLCTVGREASAHIVLGRPKAKPTLEATQLVKWDNKAWACVDYNANSDNLEIADAAWDGTDREAWKVAARIVAFRLKARGLPPSWVRNPAKGGRGFTRHYDLGAAGGGHTDPTTSTVSWLRFVYRVKFEYLRGGFRPSWGI